MTALALKGVKVLDMTSYLAGPYGGTLLGDLGADVVKVESPDGDMMRKYPSTLPGESRAYLGANRNKRTIVIDLKNPAGVDTCKRLAAGADVVIQNFRPGVAERLGLGFDDLKALRADIVYCSLTGYGLDGPMAGNPGFDQVLQSMTGIAAAQGYPEPEPRIVWGSPVDFYASSLLAMAVCAALFDRERTGTAQFVETSLLRSALAMQPGRMIWAEGEGREVQRDLRGGRLGGIHPTKSGYIYLQAQTPAFWRALCELTGLSHLVDDPRYDDLRKRHDREDELLPLLRDALAKKTALEWEAHFGSRVPCVAVRTFEDMFDHPQVLSQRLLQTHAHPELGSFRAMSGPVAINRTEGEGVERRAPMPGEHTSELLAEAGFSRGEIDALRQQGAVR